MFRLLLAMIFSFPLLLSAETIVVKTKAPHNKQAVFQYRLPKGYDKSRREMYRVLVIFGRRIGPPRLARAFLKVSDPLCLVLTATEKVPEESQSGLQLEKIQEESLSQGKGPYSPRQGKKHRYKAVHS